MRTIIVLLAATCLSASAVPALASCPTAASSSDLQNFNSDPVKWIRANKGSADVGAKARALASAAVNARDPAFGHGLYVALGHASGADGAEIGRALRGLDTTCGSPSQDQDRGDKLYIADNVVRNVASNTEANQAYGAGDVVTASTGGGSGGGGGGGAGGVGSIGAGPPSGGPNNSVIATTSPAVIPQSAPNSSFSLSGGSFTTQTSTSTSLGSSIID